MPSKLTKYQILDRFYQKWGSRFDYSQVEYTEANSKVKIICHDHGLFELFPWQHQKGVGCYKCGRIQTGITNSIKLLKSQDQFITDAKLVWGDKFDYSCVEYKHSNIPVDIICSHHGKFQMLPKVHLERRGCPRCIVQKSVPESLWLDSIGLPDDRSHRGVNLKINGKKCIVDGFDSSLNTVYEFHGDFWHGNPTMYNPTDLHPILKTTFGELYRRTKEKELNIESAGYNLVVIWESEWLTCRSTPSDRRFESY